MSLIDPSLFFKDVWQKVLAQLLDSNVVDDTILEHFYQPSSIYELTDKKCIISVPSVVHKSIISSNVRYIKKAIEEIVDVNDIYVDVVNENDLKKLDTIQAPIEEMEEILPIFEGTLINPELRFDNFVVGNCNKESSSAALACAHNPGKFFNPLFIYGNSGLGKTHLLSAIANYILEHDPAAKVYYVSTIKFVEMVVECLKNHKIDAFKKYMYSLDVLIIDDVQFLAGKEKIHEIFFNIFNELVNNRKQICIASDRLPQDIKGLEERLVTRFSSGLSCSIESPEIETSIQVLKTKLSNSMYCETSIDDDALNFIASNFSQNVRALEGALNRVIFYAIQFQQDGGRITLDTTMAALKDQVSQAAKTVEKQTLTVENIIKTVADYYGLTKQQIVSKARTGAIANARHISIYLSRSLLDLPYNKIGEAFGGRDHSTIISSFTKVEKKLKSDKFYEQAVMEIKKQLNVK